MKPTLLLALMINVFASCAHYESYTDTIRLNDHDFFYAVEGKGRPVVLLHGNGGSHSDLETMQHQLAQAGYKVYAMDSRGQGANRPVPEYHYADMANDVHAFIGAKGMNRPAVFGWSDGGIIALLLESTYPGSCSLIVTSGANMTAENAISPEAFADIFGPDSMIDSLPPLVRMMRFEPQMTHADLQRIKVPALICAGENDLILPAHTQRIVDGLSHGEKFIVAGHDHGSHIWHNPLMGDILIRFMKRNGY